MSAVTAVESSAAGLEVDDFSEGGSGSGMPPAATQQDVVLSRQRRRRGYMRKEQAPKARGAPDGPKRTPLHWGDAWQHQLKYSVEKVCHPPLL
jgi:hypothetical protein